jgi:hypothetical protein
VTRLYDLKSDPLELKDLSSDPAQSIQKKELMAKLTAMQAQLGDSLKLDQ